LFLHAIVCTSIYSSRIIQKVILYVMMAIEIRNCINSDNFELSSFICKVLYINGFFESQKTRA
jgi:hypothetical protein